MSNYKIILFLLLNINEKNYYYAHSCQTNLGGTLCFYEYESSKAN